MLLKRLKEYSDRLDLPPTLSDMLGARVPETWDGRSFARTLRYDEPAGHDYLAVSQCAWSCQRAVRWGRWLLIRTYHDGLKDFPPVMLFDLQDDPHELQDLAGDRPDLVAEGLALLERWQAEMMAGSDSAVDPLWTVIREGGPWHTRGRLEAYVERLRQTGRAAQAEALLTRYRRGAGGASS